MDPLARCSSKSMQQPLVKNARAITPAQSESVNTTELSCRLLLNLSILHVNRHAKGGAQTQQTPTVSVTVEQHKPFSA